VSRGGSGGRVAVTAREQLDLDSTLPQIQSRGGRNLSGEGRTQYDAGAGTVYLRRPGQQYGELALSSLDERAPATTHVTRPTILGYTGSGNSTSLTASTLTDSTRTFVSDAIGEELLLGSDTTKSYTITAVSSDGHTLTTDSADGSLLNATGVNNGVVAYAGMLQFDAIRSTDRALARFDDSINIGGIVDDATKATVATNGVLLLRTDVPKVTSFTTTPADGSQLIRGTSFTTSYNVTSAAGIGTATLAFSPVATPVVDTYNDYVSPASQTNKSIAIPGTATLGAATLTLSTTDRAGRQFTSAPINFTVVDNAAPTITKFDVTPASLQMYAGHTISIDAAATDDVAVTALTLATSAGTLTSQTPVNNGASTTRTFTVAVPPTIKGGTNIDLTLSATDAFAGHTPTTQVKTVAITTDPTAPAINVTSPAANQTFQVSSNVTIPVRATIADAEVGVDPATVFVSLGGGTPVALVPDSSITNGWKADLPVPSVDGTAAVTKSVVVTAKDYEGNQATTAPGFDINIQPVFDPNGPVVSWLCPSVGSGAIFPSGYTAIFRVSATGATSDNGITSVNIYVGDSTTPIAATLTNGAYQASVALPTGTEGTQVPLRVEAKSIRNNLTTVSNTVTLITGGTVINTNTAVNATNTTYENKTVVITGGTLTIDGAHTFARLLVLDGGNVTHTAVPSGGTGVNLTVTGASYISCNGTIDTTGAGYATSTTYPGATAAGGNSGGSHIGVGGLWSSPTGSTFGSIYTPREAGGGNGGNGPSGGGVVRLNAGSLSNDGAIRANGAVNSGSGAGGSIWITAANVSGNGLTEARGGDMQSCCGVTSGGGGAVAVEYTNASGNFIANLTGRGGVPNGNNRPGMSGTVFLKTPRSTYGDVIIDNKGIGNPQGLTTDFPSLGGGTAQSGSAGATLVTDRTVNIPAYFVGHWIEISTSTGTLKGTWRIAPSGINNKTVTLQPNGSETISVQSGDKWQGVYHFDTLRTNNGEAIHSTDPIRLGVNGVISLAGPTAAGQYLELFDTINATDVTVTGNVSVLTINTTNLTVKNGALLTTPNNGTTPNTLTLNVTGTMTVENGGVIDVSGRGYATSVSYPGAAVPGGNSGGSHIGVGGLWSAPTGSTFGSIYRPREAGGGNGANGPSGGGIVRINAATLNHDGAIRANGSVNSGSGAGGSVWITATNLNGAGTLDADGGDMQSCCGVTSGGGGAISVEYTNLGAGATVLNKLTAKGGVPNGNNRPGMAGTVYTRNPANTWGDVVIDNKGIGNPQGLTTDFPSLGGGTAQTGSTGATLVTDRTVNIPAYFEGHWVEISTSTGTLKGTWRIAHGRHQQQDRHSPAERQRNDQRPAGRQVAGRVSLRHAAREQR
jgi:fibronectin-binding autotransporter adhesin